MENYIAKFERQINEIEADIKAGVLTVGERNAVIKAVGDEYALNHARAVEDAKQREIESAIEGKRKPKELPLSPPDQYLVGKLADLFLYDDLNDTTSWKYRAEEYPFLSESQYARRKSGKHQRNYEAPTGEASLKGAWATDVTGKNYEVPVRRKRSNNENIRMDEATVSRNKEYRRRYREFTKVQPVYTYHVSELGREAE